jgi:hypothetical protein
MEMILQVVADTGKIDHLLDTSVIQYGFLAYPGKLQDIWKSRLPADTTTSFLALINVPSVSTTPVALDPFLSS